MEVNIYWAQKSNLHYYFFNASNVFEITLYNKLDIYQVSLFYCHLKTKLCLPNTWQWLKFLLSS